MNIGESELSKFKLYYEGEPLRKIIGHTYSRLIRRHIQRPLGHIALVAPAVVRRRRR